MRYHWWKYLLFAGWIFFVGWLLKNEYGSAEEVRPLDVQLFNEQSQTSENTAWYTIYLGDQKIGWNMHIASPRGDGYSIYDRTVLRVPVAGTLQNIDYEQSVNTDSNYVLQQFVMQLSASAMNTRIEGRKQRGGVNLTITSGGNTQKQFIPMEEDVRLPVTLAKMLPVNDISPGDKFSFPVFDPSTLSMGKAILEAHDWETISVGNSEVEALHVTTTFQELSSDFWVNHNGEVVKEKSLMNLTMVRSSSDDAQRFNPKDSNTDLYQYFAVIPDQPIKHPRKQKLLKLQLHNSDLPVSSLDNHRQIATPGKDGPRLQIRTRGQNREAPPSPKELQSTPLIQCTDSAIVAASNKIVHSSMPDSEKVRTLVQWVYSIVKKQPSVGLPSAVEVLQHRTGDCNEHTVLFVALARAAGIPAKMRAGLVYVQNGFYYHAWAAAYVNNHWIDVDPTFGQYAPDATHIALAEGELFDLMTIGRIVGRLEITLLN